MPREEGSRGGARGGAVGRAARLSRSTATAMLREGRAAEEEVRLASPVERAVAERAKSG